MKNNSMKWFALLGVILFIGMVLTPSINAGVVKESIKEQFEKDIQYSLDKIKKRQTINSKLKNILTSLNYIEKIQHRLLYFYSSIFTNETFIQLLENPQIQSVLPSPSPQKILHSQEFKDFITSDACQQLLNHFPCSLTQLLKQNDSTQNNTLERPTIGQILLFILTWFVFGILLWLPGILVLFIILWPMGTIFWAVFCLVHNQPEIIIFIPLVLFILCILISVTWPFFSIWAVYRILENLGLFPDIPWLPW